MPRMSDRPAVAMPSIAQLAKAIVIGGCALAFVIPLATRCLTMADEGYLLLQALDMAHGKVLYRDMDAFVTPGMWFLLAGVFELMEPSVIASRVPVVVAYLLLIALAYRIPALIGGTFAGLVSVVIMMMCTVWAFPAWTMAFYSPFSVLFALAALERLLVFRASREHRDLLLTGLLLGLAIVFKQNYGTFALVGSCLALFALRFEAGQPVVGALRGAFVDALRLAIGIVAVALPTIGYLAYSGALTEAFYSLVVHPFEFSGKHGIPYLPLGSLFTADVLSETLDIMTYGAQPIYRTPMPTGVIQATRLIERLHVLLYWFPPLIAILGVTLALTRGDTKDDARRGRVHGGLLSVLLVCFFVFCGIFPRADFNHLINVYQPIVIAGVSTFAVLLDRRHPSLPWFRRAVGAGLAVVLVLYFVVSSYWYYALIHTMSFDVEGSRGGVKISPPEASSLRQVLRNLERLSPPGEPLLTIPDIAMLNFLSKRPMPSVYYNLYEHHIAHDGGAAVAAEAEAHGTTVAITRLNNFFSDRVGIREYAPELTRYLDTHFEQRYTIGRAEYLLYTRRDDPAAPETFSSILDDCSWSGDQTEIENHLLFRSLYQTMGPGHENHEDTLVARCPVRIPEAGGEFVWQMDYPFPVKLRTPATLFVEVQVVDRGSTSRVFTETLSIKTAKARRSRIPAPREYRVDLSRYAGRQVELVLRSTRTGRVVMSANEIRGFGMRWQHPRVVAR